MRKIATASLSAGMLFVFLTAATALPPRPAFQPPQGFVPDAETAIRIAVAVWSPIYGRRPIEGEKPYHATLSRGIWTVTGSLPAARHGEVRVGGVAMEKIAKSDGHILQVVHGK